MRSLKVLSTVSNACQCIIEASFHIIRLAICRSEARLEPWVME